MKKKKLFEKYTASELAEAFVFRNKLTDAEKEQDAKDIAEFRKTQRPSRKTSSIEFKLLQLKYQMEKYIDSTYSDQFTFAYYLKNYVQILDIKHQDFARQISIDETYLSQLINRHRSPSEEVIIRLEIHSKNLIDAITWFKIYEKEKENEIETNKAIRIRQKKFVKQTVSL